MKTPREIAMDIRPTHPHVTELICRMQDGIDRIADGRSRISEHLDFFITYQGLETWDAPTLKNVILEIFDRHVFPRTSPHPEGHMERDGLGNARFVKPGDGE